MSLWYVITVAHGKKHITLPIYILALNSFSFVCFQAIPLQRKMMVKKENNSSHVTAYAGAFSLCLE